MTHTRTPWEYDGKFQICIPHKDGTTCFRTMKEDAEFIIRAVNSHYELLEAAKIILRDLHKLGAIGPVSVQSLTLLVNAIEKAEGI